MKNIKSYAVAYSALITLGIILLYNRARSPAMKRIWIGCVVLAVILVIGELCWGANFVFTINNNTSTPKIVEVYKVDHCMEDGRGNQCRMPVNILTAPLGAGQLNTGVGEHKPGRYIIIWYDYFKNKRSNPYRLLATIPKEANIVVLTPFGHTVF